MRSPWSSVIHEYSGQKPVLEDSTSAVSVSIIRMTDVCGTVKNFILGNSAPFSALLKCHISNISGGYLTGWSSLFAELLKISTDICIHPPHVLVNTFIQITKVLRHNFKDQDRQTQSKRGSGSQFMHGMVFWAFAEVFSLRMLLFCLHCCYLYGHLCYWLWETLDSNALTSATFLYKATVIFIRRA